MGGDGLRARHEVAILTANYVAHRLAPHYPVLYSGPDGLVAHECILDLRPITAATGVTVDDVAKRLIDYGFHAPTMSFPVAGTLMVEPTESEDLAELDRFCDAMIAIRDEIRAGGARGVGGRREPAACTRRTRRPTSSPTTWIARVLARAGRVPRRGRIGAGDKYWPPVSRIDGAYGDRNLMCSCPPLSALRGPTTRGGLTHGRPAARDLRPGHPFALPPRVRPAARRHRRRDRRGAARPARAAGHRRRLEHRRRLRPRPRGDACSPDDAPGDARAASRRSSGDGRRAPATQHDMWVWTHGTGEDVELDVARGDRRCARRRSPTLAAEQPCFVYHDSRDLTGFIDGTENPPVEEAHDVAIVARRRAGGGRRVRASPRSGCTTSAQFHAQSVEDQEGTIGRTKPDSVELDDKPDTAHISRVVIEEDGEELEIYRRSTPYGRVGELGLYFVAFSADPSRFTKMLAAMFGTSGDGLHDHLTDFTTPVSGAFYFAPSARRARRHPARATDAQFAAAASLTAVICTFRNLLMYS